MMCFRLALLFVAFSLPLTLPGQARADGLFTPLPLTLEVDYDFEDQSLGPVGIGGAEAGQPVRVGPGLQAEVIEFGTGNQALQISRSTSGGGAVSFGLPGGASIDEGLVRIRFQYTPLGFDNYSIAFGSPTSTGGGFVGIRPRSDGTIRAASSGLTSVPVIGSYTPGETLDFTVDINLDTWTWSAELDGEVVVNNAVFTADSELGRVHFGYWGSGDDRQPMLADDIEILTTEPLVTLLQADFNDKTVDTPLGTGGASVGEPLVINPNLTARIISFDGDDHALTIEKTGATSVNTFIDWAFLQDAAISEGHLLGEFDLTPRGGMMHQFRLEATNGGGTSEELLRISTENLGQIRVRFPDDFFGPIVGNYEVDETLKVSIVCNLDDRDCSVALDGAWVVQNRAFAAATSADIAIDRFLSGVSGPSDLGGDYDLNNLRIRASRAPGIAAEMAFIDQPVDIQCGDGQPLNVQVSAGDGGPAADMIDVFLRPDHPEITQDDMAGFSTFTWEGVAEFPSLAVLKRGNSLRLVAEIDDPFNPVSVTSEPFNILAGTPSSSSYLEEPGDGFVGQTFDPPVRLQILDNCGENSVAGREITLYVLNGPAGATLSGETATTNADGEVVFPDFSIDQPGTYRIAARFDDVVISSSSSPFFTIEATPPAAAVFQVQPATVIVTQTMTPAVEVTVENTLELPVPDGTEVSLALVDPGSATLTGATATTTDGVAIFDALQIDQPGSYQLRASVPDLPADNEPVSALFDVTPGPVAVLSFETQPTSVDAGAAISPAVTVAVTDINGFAVVDGTTVALSLASGPAEGELLGTLEQGTIDGMATFPGLSLQVTGTYTLQASVEGLQVTSSEFQITASTIHVLAYLTPPSDGTVNQPLSPPVVVEARDQYGKLMTAERTISLSRFEFPEGGFHSGDSATSIDGIATFDSVTMTKPGTWRLRANST
ncbi:MAG: hypothetical protein LAT56_12200, partial [Wenzhouxiangella sp.]|nr:hypothetical protein [Wenzhouxiangella sp.]